MLADDIVICSLSRQQLEENLERNERETSGRVRLRGGAGRAKDAKVFFRGDKDGSRWFGHVQRRDSGGRLKRRYVKEEMQVVGVRLEDTKNRVKWDSLWQPLKRKKL